MAPFNFDKLSLERQDHDEQRRVQDVAYGYTSAVYDFVHDVLFDRRWFWPFVSMLISGEAMLCLIIIKKIPCEWTGAERAADTKHSSRQIPRSTTRRTCSKLTCS